MEKAHKYNFSFTAASLRLNEMVLVAKSMHEHTALDVTNVLGAGKKSTGTRMLLEFKNRLSTLTQAQLNLLISGDLITRKQLAFLSICKYNKFIRDFVVEVVREKLLVFDYQITEADYISFFRRKSENYPEVESIKESTQYKIKQVLFKILEDAGSIDTAKSKIIQPQILDSNVMHTIVSDNRQWLKVFFMSDIDIENSI
jgi:hypothetical protein